MCKGKASMVKSYTIYIEVKTLWSLSKTCPAQTLKNHVLQIANDLVGKKKKEKEKRPSKFYKVWSYELFYICFNIEK